METRGIATTVVADWIGKVDIRYIDQDTLEVARLVAEAEGISLEQAIADQLELFGGVL